MGGLKVLAEKGPAALRGALREPLTQFLLIGLLLFVVYGWATPGSGSDRQIVVSQGRVDDMVREYQAQLGRPPTSDQLANLVDNYVHDEILYREGMSLGFGRDDAVVRRRILQKYLIIAEETAEPVEPTDAELTAYLNAHKAEFSRAGAVTFDQIVFDKSGSVAEVEGAVAAARRALASGADPASLGRNSILPRRQVAVSMGLVARDFGDAFAGRLNDAPVGEWVGPVASTYGAHLVRVSARSPSTLPTLDEVRPIVAREWEADRRKSAELAHYRKLRSGYDVVVEAELPAPPAESAGS